MRKNRTAILCVSLGLISFANSARAQGRQAGAVQDSHIQSTAGERVMEFYAIHRQTGESLPWLILTDNNHVVVSEGFQPGDLDNQLEQGSREKSGNGT